MIAVFIAVMIALIIGAIVFSYLAAQRRREELAALGAKLGLAFAPERNHALAERLEFLRKLNEGSNRYVYNHLSGTHGGHDVMLFDFHYETYSHSQKGGRRTHHHHFTVLTLRLPHKFPELLISPEGFLSKIAQAFGYDDIDFESAEFSRAFCVRSRDKKFAYDVCHTQMMEYLLARRDLAVEIDGDVLALAFDHLLDAPEIEYRLRQLHELRQLMPGYLFPKS